MIDHYILDPDGTTRRVSLMEWAYWFETQDRRIGFYERDGWWVSTVFMGIDHRFGGKGPPLLFETMTFDGREVMDQQRYSTKDDALIGHERHVRALNKKLDEALQIASTELSRLWTPPG